MHDWNHMIKHAPNGWKEENGSESQEDGDNIEKSCGIDNFTLGVNNAHKKSKEIWARIITEIYERRPHNLPQKFLRDACNSNY